MRDLFRSEFHRFRVWAMAYALLQIVVLGFMTRVVDLAQQPLTVYQVLGALYALSGLLLGLYQFGGYRRPNAWLNLLHRPLPHGRIALALLAAGALALAIAVLLPLCLIAVWQDTMTARVVDMRHIVMACSAWLISLCAYLAGTYAMLAPRRYGYSALLVLTLLYFSQATGFGAVAIQLLTLALLLAMVRVAFKPDLSAPPKGLAASALTAAPLQFAMWFALVLAGFGVEFVWIAQGSHPNNRAVPLAGGEKEAENAEGADVLVMGLEGSTARDAALWREQARISDIHATGPWLRRMPQRHELANLAPMEFDDGQRRERWVFSHDDMRFHGYSLVDRRSLGVLGVDGNTPFTQPAMPGPEGTLLSADAVYQYDSDAQRILPRLRAPAGERITGYDAAGDSVLLLSDRALYFYDAREFADGDAVLSPRQRVAFPGRAGDLQRVDLLELLDGHLVSFLFARSSYNAEGAEPCQTTVQVHEDGRVIEVARRILKPDYTPLWRFQNWFTSPLIYEAQRAIVRLFSDYRTIADTARPAVPGSIWIVAITLMLASLCGAILRTRHVDLGRRARLAWIIACGVLSVPALLSLWLMHPERERIEDIPLTHAAHA